MWDFLGFNFLSMFDGICDQTRELKTFSLEDVYMFNDEKWVISSSGRHMFVDLVIENLNSHPRFSANIHFGKLIMILLF